MSEVLETLSADRANLDGQLEALSERAAGEARQLSDAEQREADGLLGQIATIDDRIRFHVDLLDARRKSSSLVERAAGFGNAKPPPRAVPELSFGQRFVDSDAFQRYTGRGQSGAVELEGFAPVETRAAVMTTDLAIPNYVLAPRQQDITIPPMLEIVDVVSVSAGVVEWITVSGDPQAAVVAEGAAKPEATLTFTPTSAPLDTLAHWVQITRQALDDAAYIRSMIEGKLRRGIALAISDAINDAIVAATLPTATVPVGGNLLEAIRVGVGTVQANGYQPNAVVLNPADWATLDVAVMGGTLGGPTIGSTFWGLTPVPSRFQTAGIALVGDFKAGAVWFDRGVSSVFLSDSHTDLFIKNVLVILAETRGKAAVPEPLALCECSVSATGTTAASSSKK